jgi:hypothetical protein
MEDQMKKITIADVATETTNAGTETVMTDSRDNQQLFDL